MATHSFRGAVSRRSFLKSTATLVGANPPTNTATLGPDSPYHVGTVSMFGNHRGHASFSFTVALMPVLSKLNEAKPLKEASHPSIST